MSDAPGKRRPGPDRAFWFSLHGWLALPIWGLLAVVCITGTLCTISQEITWLIEPKVRAPNPDDRPALSFEAIRQAAARHTDDRLVAVHADAPYFAWRAQVASADGSRRDLHVNQYTGQVQGESSGAGLRGFLLALHGWLLQPWQDHYSIGWYLVTAASIPLLGSLVSGLVVFKRFWRSFYRPQLRTGKGSRVFLGDWHRFAGAWSIVFVLIIGVSGLWFLIVGVLEHSGLSLYPPQPVLERTGSVSSPGRQPPLPSLDRMTARARTVFPDLEVTSILLPDDAGEPATVMGRRGFMLLRDSANRVYLDPRTGDVVGAYGQEDLSPLQFAQVLLVPLHFGDFAGLGVRLVWFLFGCVLSTLVYSGLITWSKRTASATQSALRHGRTPSSASGWRRKLFRLNWLVLAAIAALIALTLYR